MKNKIRLYTQITFLVLILYVAIRPLFDKSYLADFEKYCPFGGISSLMSKLNLGSMSCSMSETQIFLGLFLLLAAGLIGKLFCGFVCPIGSVSEWLGRIGGKLKIRKDLPDKIDRPLRSAKYILLFVTIYYTMTSSELFCKNFDPYFSSVNLFNNSDINLYYAIPAFIITIAGAIFFRLFWCKYLCPLGAITNIFMNLIPSAAIIIVYIILNLLGVKIDLLWLLVGLVLSGLVNEIFFRKSYITPFTRINKSNSCSNCGFCNVKCPQGIDIPKYSVVNHIDCNLCTDCVFSCPNKNILTINNNLKLKYISPILLALFIFAALGFSSFYEFNTISLKWGTPKEKEAVYIYSGLKDIKCYGSSMSLAGKLKSVKGIIGLDTYAKSHSVKVYYDPDIISDEQVKEALFTPSVKNISEPKNVFLDSVCIYEVGIFGFFDAVDFDNLYYILKSKDGIYRVETHFGEPVKTTIYFNPKVVTLEAIKKAIESKVVLVDNNSIKEEVQINFKLDKDGIIKKTISALEYKRMIFKPIDEDFVDLDDYNKKDILVYQFPFVEAEKPERRNDIDYLISYLSAIDGVLKFKTDYLDYSYGFVYFDETKIKLESLKDALNSRKMKIYVSDTEFEEIDNPFHINNNGKVYHLINHN